MKLTVAARIEGDDGVWEGGEGDLRHLAGLEDLVAGDLAIGAQLGGHLIEGIGELAEFILGNNGDHLVEIAIAKLPGKAGERLDGHEDGALEEVGEVERARRGPRPWRRACTGWRWR